MDAQTHHESEGERKALYAQTEASKGNLLIIGSITQSCFYTL